MARARIAYTCFIIGLCGSCGGSVARHENTTQSGGNQTLGGSNATGGSQTLGGGNVTGGAHTTTTKTTTTQLPEACTLPMEVGPCKGAEPSYWHDPAIGVCFPFFYGGCEGNANRFASLAACQATCHGVVNGATELDTCSSNVDCKLIGTSCCYGCDPETERDLVAIRSDATTTYTEYRGCSQVMCEACLEVAPNQRTGRYFYAACSEGQCLVRDLRTTPLSECTTAADCTLRCGTACCSSCNPENVISLRKDADTIEEFCGGIATPCPLCDCSVAPAVSADCIAGHCTVQGEAVCTVGMDQTCNDSPIMSAIAGTCNNDGTCTCHTGRVLVESSGRCR
jgi:hypothetical protein